MSQTVIRVKVEDQTMTLVDKPVLASGGVNETKVVFDFCEKWDGYTKTGVFYVEEDNPYHALVDENDACVVPWEVCAESGYFSMAVFGDKDGVRRTAGTIRYRVGKGVTYPDMMPSDPTPTVYEQILKKMESLSGKNPVDVFLDNTDVDYAYDAETGAYYTVIRVYKQKLDGTKQYPFVYAPNGSEAGDKSTYDMTMAEGWLLAINSGVFNTGTMKPDGILIQNGSVVQNFPSATHSQCKPLTINGNGDLGYAEYNADAVELANNGIVSAVCGFMPIIEDYKPVDQSRWNSVSHYTQNAQRQIIGQWGNGDYAIITCEGRNHHNSDGWTIAEAQAICQKHGLKFAYNLDGGGSTETMLGMKHINTIYENTTGRRVPTFIVFNGTDTFNAEDAPGEEEHSHSYTSSVTKTATCTTTGVRTYTCSCGHSYTQSIPATGHSYVDGVCSICGAVDENYYDYANDYADVEYVSANYDAYINTGLDETTLYNIEYKAINANLAVNETNKWSSGHIMSSLNTYMPFMRFVDGGNGNWLLALMRRYKGPQPADLDCVVTIDEGIPHTITGYWEGDQYACAIDGVQVGIDSAGTAGYSNNKYYLFAYGGQPDTERFRFSGRFYYMKLWDKNGNMVRNFTPVQRKADGVYGLFDHVNNVFYRSESGTDFTV